MTNNKRSFYNKEIGKRLREIMRICDLEHEGFAEFIGLSDSHLYAILNGNRRLTRAKAEEIGKLLGFDGILIFNLNELIPGNISKSIELNKFKTNHKGNFEYFISTSTFSKKSYFVAEQLDDTTFISEPSYLWEIRDYLNSFSKSFKFSSDELSKILNYLVVKNKLLKVKMPLKLKSTGNSGKRLVDVFTKIQIKLHDD